MFVSYIPTAINTVVSEMHSRHRNSHRVSGWTGSGFWPVMDTYYWIRAKQSDPLRESERKTHRKYNDKEAEIHREKLAEAIK